MAKNDTLRQQAEKTARENAAQSPEQIEALSPEEMRRTLHELHVHQIELEMQNEELRRTQSELDAARTRYFDLYDLAPVGYITVSERGLILEVNLTTARLLGVAPGTRAPQPITRFIIKKDQDLYYRHHKKLLETGAPQTCELRMVKQDGTAFWAHLEATAAQAADGAPVCHIVLSDITERKQAEVALRTSEERYRILFECSQDALMTLSPPSWEFTSCNPKALEMFQAKDENEFTSFGPWHLSPALQPDGRASADKARELIETALRDGSCLFEWTHKRLGGEEFPATVMLTRMKISGQAVVQATVRDITERKRAEEALRESERKYRNLYHYAQVGLFETSLTDAKIIACNQRYCDLAGFPTVESAIGMDILPLYADPADREEVKKILREQGCITDHVLRLKNRLTGVLFWAEFSARIDPSRDIAEGTIIDITERKRAEDALRESEERYRQAQQIGHVGNWEFNLKTNTFWGSEEAKRLYGFDPQLDDFSTDEVENCIPERERVHQALIDLIQDDKLYNLEFEIKPRDTAQSRIIASLAELQKDEDGRPQKVTGVIQDITARKQVEAALRESEEKYRTVADFTYDWETWRAPGGACLYVSPSCERITGHTAAEFLADSNLTVRIAHPDDQSQVIAHYHATAQQAGEDQEFDFRILTPDGETRWISHSCAAVHSADGRWLGRRESNRDITDRKRAESQREAALEALRDLNATLEQHVADRTVELLAANEHLTELDRLKGEADRAPEIAFTAK